MAEKRIYIYIYMYLFVCVQVYDDRCMDVVMARGAHWCKPIDFMEEYDGWLSHVHKCACCMRETSYVHAYI